MKRKSIEASIVVSICMMLAAVLTVGVIGLDSVFDGEIELSDALNSVVRIEYNGQHTGSGFVIDEWKGLIITARHVVEREGNYVVVFSDGVKRNVQGIRVAERSDCAVLRVVRRSNLHAVRIETEVSVGETIYVVGSPFTVTYTNYVTRGIISKMNVLNEFFAVRHLVMIDAAASPGNSGGPVFNERGAVVGILIGSDRRGDGLNYITPATDFSDLLEGWYDEGANTNERSGQTERQEYTVQEVAAEC